MRTAYCFGALACLFSSAYASWADPEPDKEYNTIISKTEVEVRSGPSLQYYATSKLPYGERVHVVKQEEGWLAITPPSDSFSWVNSRFIGPVDEKTRVATALGTAEVRVGSALQPEKFEITWVKITSGELVVVLDMNKVTREDGTWYKIQPLPNENRYIPVDAVKSATPKVETVTPPPSAPLPGPASANATLQPPAPGDSLWYRAEQAERAGNPAEAERLFLQLARETPDHDLQMRCYNRIHFLREGRHPSYPPGYQAGRPSDSFYTNNPNGARFSPVPGYPYAQSTNPYMTTGRATSQYTYSPLPTAGQTPPTNSTANCQWSGWGWLRRAPFFVDNKPAYALENSQGSLRLYVTAQPGVNLDSYLNRTVNVYGKLSYRGDLKTNYMTACQLAPLP
jgi:uncharacterized protein YgiM (DUF1202 family)